jgi:hypothetical protein
VASKSWVSNPDYGHLPKQGKYQQQAPKQSSNPKSSVLSGSSKLRRFGAAFVD